MTLKKHSKVSKFQWGAAKVVIAAEIKTKELREPTDCTRKTVKSIVSEIQTRQCMKLCERLRQMRECVARNIELGEKVPEREPTSLGTEGEEL